MRLNGLGAPEEITLVPLKKEETSTTKIEDKDQEKKYFDCSNCGHYKTVCKKTKCEKLQETRKQNGKTSESSNPKLGGKTVSKTYQMENCWNDASNLRPTRQFNDWRKQYQPY